MTAKAPTPAPNRRADGTIDPNYPVPKDMPPAPPAKKTSAKGIGASIRRAIQRPAPNFQPCSPGVLKGLREAMKNQYRQEIFATPGLMAMNPDMLEKMLEAKVDEELAKQAQAKKKPVIKFVIKDAIEGEPRDRVMDVTFKRPRDDTWYFGLMDKEESLEIPDNWRGSVSLNNLMDWMHTVRKQPKVDESSRLKSLTQISKWIAAAASRAVPKPDGFFPKTGYCIEWKTTGGRQAEDRIHRVGSAVTVRHPSPEEALASIKKKKQILDDTFEDAGTVTGKSTASPCLGVLMAPDKNLGKTVSPDATPLPARILKSLDRASKRRDTVPVVLSPGRVPCLMPAGCESVLYPYQRRMLSQLMAINERSSGPPSMNRVIENQLWRRYTNET
jgi:hypothetical protein